MKKVRVLLVDDEQEFVETMADRLQLREVQATTAYNGEEALAVVEEEEPDVIVLDLRMPGIDGLEVLRRVKRAYPKIEVIILTGHGTQQDEEAARTIGAFDYVTKPADLDELVRRIKNAFQQRLKKLQDMSVAVAFAEAGDFDTARRVMEDGDKKKK